MSPAEIPVSPSPVEGGPSRRRVSNLHDGLLRLMTADHGGNGSLLAHRAYERAGAPAEVAFIDLVVLPPGASIGLHRHADDEETYVILIGRGLMTLNGDEFRVGPGDLIVNQPYGEHGLINDEDTDLHLLVFEVGPLGHTGETE